MSAFKTWTDFHHKLNLIFHVIVAVTMLPFVWLCLELDTEKRTGILTDPVLIGLFIAVCASLATTAFIYKKKLLSDVIRQPSLRQKLGDYQRLLLVFYMLLEAAAVFATLAFYLTANYLFVAVYMIILIMFSFGRPHLERTSRELQLSIADRELLTERKEIAE